MTEYMRRHRESFIEDYWRGGPDWANGDAYGGDSDSDWLPAFARYLTQHLTTKTGASLPKQRTYRQPTLWLGKEHQNYPVSGTLNIFGATIRGLFPNVTITFASGVQRGVHVHFPDISGGHNGTSHWLDGIWSHVAGYGGGLDLRDVILQMHGTTEGSIGLLIQGSAHVENVQVHDAGWHGVVVSAGHSREAYTPETHEFPGYSLSNTVNLLRMYVSDCGNRPGTHPFWESVANPAGYRPFGCGLKIEGEDANDTTVYRFKTNGTDVNNGGGSGWAIDDNSFLGCSFTQAFSVNNERYVAQFESDIVNGVYGTPTENELDEFAHPVVDEGTGLPTASNVAVGEKVNFAFRSRTSSGSEWGRFYIENATPRPIVDIRAPSWRIANNNSMPRYTTWGISGGNEMTVSDGTSYYSTKHTATNRKLYFQPSGNFWRWSHNGSNNCPAYITNDNCQASDGRALDVGKFILASHYVSGAFANGLPGGCYPFWYGTQASLPDLSNAAIAAKWPVGAWYNVTDPIAGGASSYRCVADGGAPYGKSWKALLLEA